MPHALALRHTKIVTDQCTCGATLPPDARFCHKCGRPLFEEPAVAPEVEQEAPAETPAIAAPIAPAPIGFSNVAAVRVGLIVSAVVCILLSLPVPALFQAVWQLILLLAGGFISVYLYHRRTGDYLSVRSGARLGWITGVFCFLIMTVMFTISIFMISSDQGLSEFFRETVNMRGTPAIADQLNEILATPAGVGALLFGIVATFFLMLTIVSMLGGALGA